MRSMMWLGGRLVDLDPDEAWRLLPRQTIGRLAWQGADGISVTPLNYVVADDTIWLRVAAYSAMAREARDQQVAFQVDDIDEGTRSGWSVLVRGTARTVYGIEVPGIPPVVEVWPEGIRALQVAVEPHQVTGRRLLGS